MMCVYSMYLSVYVCYYYVYSMYVSTLCMCVSQCPCRLLLLQVASSDFKWFQGKNWPLLEMQEPSGRPVTLKGDLRYSENM